MSHQGKQRPAIAGAALDAESGTAGDGAAEAAKALHALTVMRDRGLISAEEFERRRAALQRKND